MPVYLPRETENRLDSRSLAQCPTSEEANRKRDSLAIHHLCIEISSRSSQPLYEYMPASAFTARSGVRKDTPLY